MIESRGAALRAASASACAALCAVLCSFSGVGTGAGGASSAAPVLEWSVSADGRHVAISAARGRASQYDAWLVSVADGAVRELEEVERAAPQLEFDAAGRLRVYTLDAERGTPALVWFDPASLEVLDSTRDRARIRAELEPLEHGWARVSTRRVGERNVARRVDWPEQRKHFALDSKRDVELSVAESEGVVFYTRRVGDQLRLVRRDLRNDSERTLVAEGRGLVAWQVSRDGRSVAVVERSGESRIRVLDAESGQLVAGPWLGDEAAWAPGESARCLIVSSGERRQVIDVLLGKQHEAGDWTRLAALSDGSYVVQIERDLVLLDSNLSERRVLFQGASLPSLSTREQ